MTSVIKYSPGTPLSRSTHGGEGSQMEKPHKCDQCQMAFRDKASLARQKRTHTGEKPFQCDVCDKSFSQKSGLKTHYRKHTGKKPYQCNQCGKAFSEKAL